MNPAVKERLARLTTDIQHILLDNNPSTELATQFMRLSAEKTKLLEEEARQAEDEQQREELDRIEDLRTQRGRTPSLTDRRDISDQVRDQRPRTMIYDQDDGGYGNGVGITAPYQPENLWDTARRRPALAQAFAAQMRAPGPVGRRMHDLFGRPEPLRWRSSSDFFQAIALKLHSSLLQPSAAMGEGSGSTGGFLVPAELAFMVLDEALNREIVRPRAMVVPMHSQTLTIPAYDGSDQSVLSAMYGFTFRWLGESQTVTPGDGTVRGLVLTAHLGGIYLSVSNELVQDAPRFEADLSGRLFVAIAANLDQSFLTGDGMAKPLGVAKSGALLTVAKKVGQTAATVVWENIVAIAAGHANFLQAVWVVSPSVLAALGGLTIAGTGLIPALSSDANGNMTLLGRPLFSSSMMPVIGTTTDIGLYDFSAYVIGLRQQMGLESSAHVGFLSNSTAYRALLRVDGTPKIGRKYTGPDSQSYSPFVTVETRA